MTNTFAKLQSASVQQAEKVLDLITSNIDNTQQVVDFQTASARQFLTFVESHSDSLIDAQASGMTSQPISAAVREFWQVWGDYVLGGKTLVVDFQRKAQETFEEQARALSAGIANNVSQLKAPHPAGNELLDITVRSWTSATEKSFEQVNAWQKNLESASEAGSKVLAALAAQATRTPAAKRRTNAVAA